MAIRLGIALLFVAGSASSCPTVDYTFEGHVDRPDGQSVDGTKVTFFWREAGDTEPKVFRGTRTNQSGVYNATIAINPFTEENGVCVSTRILVGVQATAPDKWRATASIPLTSKQFYTHLTLGEIRRNVTVTGTGSQTAPLEIED